MVNGALTIVANLWLSSYWLSVDPLNAPNMSSSYSWTILLVQLGQMGPRLNVLYPY